MPDANDMALLREYAAGNSEMAFETVVRRHVSLVYAIAMRQVGNPAHAEEITQAVFLILARKAARLSPGTVLAGWLHETTRFAAASFLRGEQRRHRREQEAYMQSKIEESSADPTWEQLEPLLDEAIGQLGKTDRNAVVLRFFQNKSAREIAAVLNVQEAAAQKRLNRAVEKLRAHFLKRGVAVSSGALTGAISLHSAPGAPIHLATSVMAVSAKGAAVSGSTLTLIQGALKLMAWTKAKTAIAVGIGLLFAGTLATTVVVEHHRSVAAQALNSFHLRGRMRSFPDENLSSIGSRVDFVTVELWEQFTPSLAWRFSKGESAKSGRVAVMDGQSALAYIKGNNMAIKWPDVSPGAFDTDWIHNIARLKKSVNQEIRSAKAKGWTVNTTTESVGGRAKSVVTINAQADLPDGSELKNVFVQTADCREVYHFDDSTKQLEAVQIYLEEKSGETLVFESTQIDYNQKIAPSLFHLDLPADVGWYKEPQKVEGNDPYAKLTPDQAAKAFFEACSRENWDEAAKFWTWPLTDRVKQYLGGVKVINLGPAFAAAAYSGRFVPYEIQVRGQPFNLMVSDNNAAGRYVILGSYNNKLELQEELKWTNQPAPLANNDPDAKLGPAAVVKAYFQAMTNSDWAEMGKFTPQSDVTDTRRQLEEARKVNVPIPQFEVGEAVWSAEHSAYFVKCIKRGIVAKSKMAIRNDNPAKHWVVDGGI
jgi:RNA polymerase sigma factor (sigma-70 family)